MKIEVHISDREVAIIQSLADGHRDAESAHTMGMPAHKFSSIKYGLMMRVGVENACQLVAFGFRNGLIK